MSNAMTLLHSCGEFQALLKATGNSSIAKAPINPSVFQALKGGGLETNILPLSIFPVRLNVLPAIKLEHIFMAVEMVSDMTEVIYSF